jgi:cytochrome c peroxidase
MRSHHSGSGRPTPFSDEQTLGAALYSDKTLSLNRNQSCASCHSLQVAHDQVTKANLPAPGFVDPVNVETGFPVSKGSVSGKFGGLNAPSAGYAAFSPAFHWDSVEGLFVGGQFWNGRASSLKDQAGGPFLNPAEMAMPSKLAVVNRLKENATYRESFSSLYGFNLSSATDAASVSAVYDAMTKAIASFEKTRQFNKFNSKFDFYLAGVIDLSAKEKAGLNLFTGKAQCALCHISDPGVAPDGTPLPPLFTDFTYDNIGVPRNTRIPGNPAPDAGLGGRADVAAIAPDTELGKHKVMSLRNIAVTPPYAHNGVFATLEQVTHFYNTRDTLGSVSSDQALGFGVTGWPAPEVPETVNVDELGNLGLSADEESAVVAFLKTLTDDYPNWGNDPLVPKGTPSPFANTSFPPFP